MYDLEWAKQSLERNSVDWGCPLHTCGNVAYCEDPTGDFLLVFANGDYYDRVWLFPPSNRDKRIEVYPLGQVAIARWPKGCWAMNATSKYADTRTHGRVAAPIELQELHDVINYFATLVAMGEA